MSGRSCETVIGKSDGRFSMNESGELTSIEGYPVLDSGGAPIQLDPRNGPPKAGADGSLRQNGQLAGAIGLYNFDPGENFVRFHKVFSGEVDNKITGDCDVRM